MIVVYPVISGLLFIDLWWANTVVGSGLPERTVCSTCLDWSEAERRCWASELLVEWPCGVPVELRLLTLAEDELWPQRTEQWFSLVVFDPLDLDWSGSVGVEDAILSQEIHWDWDQDGVVSALDQVNWMKRYMRVIVLNRNAGGTCPGGTP